MEFESIKDLHNRARDSILKSTDGKDHGVKRAMVGKLFSRADAADDEIHKYLDYYRGVVLFTAIEGSRAAKKDGLMNSLRAQVGTVFDKLENLKPSVQERIEEEHQARQDRDIAANLHMLDSPPTKRKEANGNPPAAKSPANTTSPAISKSHVPQSDEDDLARRLANLFPSAPEGDDATGNADDPISPQSQARFLNLALSSVPGQDDGIPTITHPETITQSEDDVPDGLDLNDILKRASINTPSLEGAEQPSPETHDSGDDGDAALLAFVGNEPSSTNDPLVSVSGEDSALVPLSPTGPQGASHADTDQSFLQSSQVLEPTSGTDTQQLLADVKRRPGGGKSFPSFLSVNDFHRNIANYLVIDIRPAASFKLARIEPLLAANLTSFNIPASTLAEGMSFEDVKSTLPSRGERGLLDRKRRELQIVVLTSSTSRKDQYSVGNTPLQWFLDAVQMYGGGVAMPGPPLVLDGGYAEYFHAYPSNCSGKPLDEDSTKAAASSKHQHSGTSTTLPLFAAQDALGTASDADTDGALGLLSLPDSASFDIPTLPDDAVSGVDPLNSPTSLATGAPQQLPHRSPPVPPVPSQPQSYPDQATPPYTPPIDTSPSPSGPPPSYSTASSSPHFQQWPESSQTPRELDTQSAAFQHQVDVVSEKEKALELERAKLEQQRLEFEKQREEREQELAEMARQQQQQQKILAQQIQQQQLLKKQSKEEAKAQEEQRQALEAQEETLRKRKAQMDAQSQQQQKQLDVQKSALASQQKSLEQERKKQEQLASKLSQQQKHIISRQQQQQQQQQRQQQRRQKVQVAQNRVVYPNTQPSSQPQPPPSSHHVPSRPPPKPSAQGTSRSMSRQSSVQQGQHRSAQNPTVVKQPLRTESPPPTHNRRLRRSKSIGNLAQASAKPPSSNVNPITQQYLSSFKASQRQAQRGSSSSSSNSSSGAKQQSPSQDDGSVRRPSSSSKPSTPSSPQKGPTPSVNRAAKPAAALTGRCTPQLSILRRHSMNPVHSISKQSTGLKNIGNTCYMNTVLQCLAHNPALSRYFVEKRYRSDLNRKNFLGCGGDIAEEFAELLTMLSAQAYRYLSPTMFKAVFGQHRSQFNGSDQQDCQEFANVLLDCLHEDLNRVKEKPAHEEISYAGLNDFEAGEKAIAHHRRYSDSFISDLFEGQYRSITRCLHCGYESVNFSPFTFLTLPIPSNARSTNIDACLAQFKVKEKMSGGNRWHCDQCETKRDAVKEIGIWRLPPCLIIHLKRFTFAGPFKDKINSYVSFPLNGLSFQRNVMNPLERKKSFKLYAVANHYGSLSSGHYIAYARTGKSWEKFDDSAVRSLRESEVCTSAAYLLFYSTF